MVVLRRATNTRESILELLRHRDGLSVDEFAKELELAGATVRRHLDVLQRDGYVSVTQVRGRTGRPRYAFSLTESGAEFFGRHYVRITHRLLQEIGSLTPEETTGRAGPELAELVFAKLSDRLVSEYRPRVAGATLLERARIALELLEEEGFDFDLVEDGAELVLLGRGCPCARLRRGHNGHGGAEPCAHDRELLAGVIGCEVEPLARPELPGGMLCGYRLRERSTVAGASG